MSKFNRNRVEDWLDMIEAGNAIAIIWSVNDVLNFLDHRGMKLTLSQAQQVLRFMQDNHHAEKGISWHDVEYWGRQVLKQY